MTNRETKQIIHQTPNQGNLQRYNWLHKKTQAKTLLSDSLLPIHYNKIIQHTMVIILVLSVLIVANTPTSYAGNNISTKEYNINPKKKIETVIGAGLLNRIHIDFATIMEVVGDESRYSIHWSGDYRNLFIFPKVEVGETIEVSFIMSGGVAQDVIFTVGDCDSKSIILRNKDKASTKYKNLNSQKTLSILDHELKYEINKMLRAMFIGDKDKYYVIDTKRIIAKNNKLLIKQEKAYRYKSLTGAVLSVKNKSTNIIRIEQSDIQHIFHNPIAVNIKQRIIQPKALAQILVVTKDSEEE